MCSNHTYAKKNNVVLSRKRTLMICWIGPEWSVICHISKKNMTNEMKRLLFFCNASIFYIQLLTFFYCFFGFSKFNFTSMTIHNVKRWKQVFDVIQAWVIWDEIILDNKMGKYVIIFLIFFVLQSKSHLFFCKT